MPLKELQQSVGVNNAGSCGGAAAGLATAIVSVADALGHKILVAGTVSAAAEKS
jgi:hypothetical protein